MIRFAEISTKQSGARFSISFSKQTTKTKYQMNPPPIPLKQPPLFANNFVFEPMPNPENPINGLHRFYGRASFALLGNRNPFWLTSDRRDGAVPRRTEQGSSQNLEPHLYPGLFSNDDDVAPDHCSLENVFADGEKVFSRALV